jgi:VCBS repeat-containing protein
MVEPSNPWNPLALTQANGQPFSLLSIDLARNFAFDPAPSVTFTGTLAGGGTVMETFTVTEPAGFPQTFTTIHFTGFTNLTSVSWDQPVFTQGLHQFTNIDIPTGVVPEPSALKLLALGVPLALAYTSRARRRRG